MPRIIVWLLLMLFIPSFSYSQEEVSFIEFNILPDKQAYEVGEKIDVTLQFKNCSPPDSEPMVVAKDTLATTLFDIFGPDQQKVEFTCPHPTQQPPGKDRFITVPAGEVYAVKRNISNCWKLDKPGTYEIVILLKFDNFYWEDGKKFELADALRGDWSNSGTTKIEIVTNK